MRFIVAFALMTSSVVAYGRSIVDLGWLRANQEAEGWRVVWVVHNAPSGQNILSNDVILAVDNLPIADLNGLSAAYALNRIPYFARSVKVIRNGSSAILKFFPEQEPLLLNAWTGPEERIRIQMHARASAAPSISLADSVGQVHKVTYGPKWTLVHIWQPQCPPCLQDIPALNEISHPAMESLMVVEVVVDEDAAGVEALSRLYPIAFSNLFSGGWNNNVFVERFDVSVTPMDILVNPKGDVVFVGIGVTSLRSALTEFKSESRLSVPPSR